MSSPSATAQHHDPASSNTGRRDTLSPLPLDVMALILSYVLNTQPIKFDEQVTKETNELHAGVYSETGGSWAPSVETDAWARVQRHKRWENKMAKRAATGDEAAIRNSYNKRFSLKYDDTYVPFQFTRKNQVERTYNLHINRNRHVPSTLTPLRRSLLTFGQISRLFFQAVLVFEDLWRESATFVFSRHRGPGYLDEIEAHAPFTTYAVQCRLRARPTTVLRLKFPRRYHLAQIGKLIPGVSSLHIEWSRINDVDLREAICGSDGFLDLQSLSLHCCGNLGKESMNFLLSTVQDKQTMLDVIQLSSCPFMVFDPSERAQAYADWRNSTTESGFDPSRLYVRGTLSAKKMEIEKTLSLSRLVASSGYDDDGENDILTRRRVLFDITNIANPSFWNAERFLYQTSDPIHLPPEVVLDYCFGEVQMDAIRSGRQERLDKKAIDKTFRDFLHNVLLLFYNEKGNVWGQCGLHATMKASNELVELMRKTYALASLDKFLEDTDFTSFLCDEVLRYSALYRKKNVEPSNAPQPVDAFWNLRTLILGLFDNDYIHGPYHDAMGFCGDFVTELSEAYANIPSWPGLLQQQQQVKEVNSVVSRANLDMCRTTGYVIQDMLCELVRHSYLLRDEVDHCRGVRLAIAEMCRENAATKAVAGIRSWEVVKFLKNLIPSFPFYPLEILERAIPSQDIPMPPEYGQPATEPTPPWMNQMYQDKAVVYELVDILVHVLLTYVTKMQQRSSLETERNVAQERFLTIMKSLEKLIMSKSSNWWNCKRSPRHFPFMFEPLPLSAPLCSTDHLGEDDAIIQYRQKLPANVSTLHDLMLYFIQTAEIDVTNFDAVRDAAKEIVSTAWMFSAGLLKEFDNKNNSTHVFDLVPGFNDLRGWDEGRAKKKRMSTDLEKELFINVIMKRLLIRNEKEMGAKVRRELPQKEEKIALYCICEAIADPIIPSSHLAASSKLENADDDSSWDAELLFPVFVQMFLSKREEPSDVSPGPGLWFDAETIGDHGETHEEMCVKMSAIKNCRETAERETKANESLKHILDLFLLNGKHENANCMKGEESGDDENDCADVKYAPPKSSWRHYCGQCLDRLDAAHSAENQELARNIFFNLFVMIVHYFRKSNEVLCARVAEQRLNPEAEQEENFREFPFNVLSEMIPLLEILFKRYLAFRIRCSKVATLERRTKNNDDTECDSHRTDCPHMQTARQKVNARLSLLFQSEFSAKQKAQSEYQSEKKRLHEERKRHLTELYADHYNKQRAPGSASTGMMENAKYDAIRRIPGVKSFFITWYLRDHGYSTKIFDALFSKQIVTLLLSIHHYDPLPDDVVGILEDAMMEEEEQNWNVYDTANWDE